MAESKVAGEMTLVESRGGPVSGTLRRIAPDEPAHELVIGGGTVHEGGVWVVSPEDIVLALSASGYYGSEHVGSAAAQRLVGTAGDTARDALLARVGAATAGDEALAQAVGGASQALADEVAQAVRSALLYATGLVRPSEERHLQPVGENVPGSPAAPVDG